MLSKLYMLALGLVLFSLQTTAQVAVYPAQAESFNKNSSRFIVNVISNNEKKSSYTYASYAGNDDARILGKQQNKSFNYSIFSFAGSVTVEVIKLGSKATKATLRPTRLALGTVNTTQTEEGAKATFTLNKPAKVSVEFNDDPYIVDAMMVFANAPEIASDVPSTKAANVFVVANNADIYKIPPGKNIIYFPPGVFEIDYWRIPISIKQVYVSGGAFVRGYFFAQRNTAAPLTINGRGVLSNDIYPFHYPENDSKNMSSSKGWYKMIQINNGKNNIIDGLTLVDGSAFYILVGSDSSLVNNVNIQGFKYNNDGITKGSNNLTIKDCFTYLNEDVIVVYGNSVQVLNSTFWQLQNGSLLQLGWRPHKISGNNIINNCTIMHAGWTSKAENGGLINAMNTVASTDAEKGVENFTISNIYVEEPVNKFVEIKMAGLRKQPNWFKNFTFDSIYFNKNQDVSNSLINLSDYDNNNKISNFSFKKIYVNGQEKGRTLQSSKIFTNKN